MPSKRIKTVTTINGRRVTADKARVSVFDNAVLYADGVFETFLSIDNKVVFLEEHLERLFRGSKVLDLKLPVSPELLSRWMQRTIEYHPASVKKLRLTITRGEAVRWVGIPGKPQVILSAAPHTLPRRPFRIRVSSFRVDQSSSFRQIKTLSYAINATAFNQAKALGFDDALLLNSRGRVAEITTANVFWVSGGQVHTPPLSSGCLEGVTRLKAIEAARALGFKTKERDVTLADLGRADEAFLTSSLKLLLPIGEIHDGHHRWRFATGSVTRAIRKRLRTEALS